METATAVVVPASERDELMGVAFVCYDGSVSNPDVFIAALISAVIIAVVTIYFIDCTKNHDDKTDARFYWWPVAVLVPFYITMLFAPIIILRFMCNAASGSMKITPCFIDGPPVLLPLLIGFIVGYRYLKSTRMKRSKRIPEPDSNQLEE